MTAVLGDRPSARVLLEASTESEWVAQHLEALGHEVIVADPNYAPIYATRRRRVAAKRITALELSPTLEAELTPLFQVLGPLNEQLVAADAHIAALLETDPIVALLATALRALRGQSKHLNHDKCLST